MKQIGLLLIFLLLLLASLGANIYFWQNQTTLSTTAVTNQANATSAQATLVQVMDEQQTQLSTRTAVELTRQAERTAQTIAQQQLDQQVNQLQTALTAVASSPRTPNETNPATPNPTPLVRLTLVSERTTYQVGQPIDLLASASHPAGISLLSVSVNDTPLLVDSPTDLPLHTAAIRYVPRRADTYRFTALATSTAGRASQPVTLNITVIPQNADINEAVRHQIETQVAELRQLTQLDPIFPLLLDRPALAEKLAANAEMSLDRAQLDREAIALHALDFIPFGYDLYEATLQTLQTAVAGYYDSQTNEFVVVSNGNTMTAEERLTYAHEFMHALQDQHFQLEQIQNPNLNADQRLALRAVGEGEAVLIEYLYQARGYLTGEELNESEQLYGTPETANLADFLVTDFNFPYTRGYDFISNIYETQGFEGVTAVWQNLPQSTEQILHPEKYLAQENPITVTLPDIRPALNGDWQLMKQDVLGEFYLRQYLTTQLDGPTARTAAQGWGGDQYAVYYQPETKAVFLLMRLTWDTAAEQQEFTTAYTTFAQRRTTTQTPNNNCWSGIGDVICLHSTELESWVIRAPTAAQATTVLQALLNP